MGERLGSGDGERKTLLTRQIAFEPLPASVLFALVWPMVVDLEFMIGLLCARDGYVNLLRRTIEVDNHGREVRRE